MNGSIQEKYLEIAKKSFELAEKLDNSQEAHEFRMKAAQNLWKAKQWEQAISLPKELEEWSKAGECCRDAGIHSVAARFFEKAQFWDKAAADWERVGRCKEAERCWKEAGQEGHVEKCRVKQTIQRLNWTEGASYYEKQGEWFNAARYWLLADKADKAAMCSTKGRAREHENLRNFVKAATAWGKVNEREAQCWEKAGEERTAASVWGNAALAWERARKWENAARCWKKAEQRENEAEAWEIVQRWDKAADCWKESEHKEKNFHIQYCEASVYREKKNQEEAKRIRNNISADQLQKEGVWDSASQVLEEIYRWKEAAECWQKAEEWEKAANFWEREGKSDSAIYCRKFATLVSKVMPL